VKTLLRKIDSVRRSRERGFNPAKETKKTSNKYVRRVGNIFNNLPKPSEWLSFFDHDFPLLMDFCEEVRDVSIQHRLNRSQTRSLAKLKAASGEEFQEIAGVAQIPWPAGAVHKASSDLNICDLSDSSDQKSSKSLSSKGMISSGFTSF